MPERPPAPSPRRTPPSKEPSAGAERPREHRAHLVLRFVAMGVGFPLLTLAVAGWLGLAIESPWIALGLAAVITVLPTLLLADRLLPEDDPRKGEGIATDAIALVWLGGATLLLGPLAFVVNGPLRAWTERAVGPGIAVTLVDFLTAPAEDEVAAPRAAEPDATADAGTPDAGGSDASAATNEPTAEPEAPADDAGTADPAEPEDAGSVDDAGTDADTPDAGNDAGAATANLSPAEVFRTFASAVVSIEVDQGRERQGGGTGFVLDTRGVVATNHHVIANARGVRVKLLDGSYAESVELLVDDADDDLALLQIQTSQPLHAVRLGDSDRVEVGERAIVIGNPLGLEHTLSDGIVSARRRIEEHNMIQMTAPVSPGNSGGPVFDGHGEVIGVTTAVVGIGIGQNLNLAVPVNVLRGLVRDEYPDRRRFGGATPSGRGGHW